MTLLANVALTNTFNQWRINTNYLIDRHNHLLGSGARQNVYGANGLFYQVSTSVSANFGLTANAVFSNVDKLFVKGGIAPGTLNQVLQLKNATTGKMGWANLSSATAFSVLTGKIANTQFPSRLGLQSNTSFANGVNFLANVQIASITALKIRGANTGQFLYISNGTTGQVGVDTLGTMAQQDAGSVSITGGSISGITALPVLSGGTGSSTAAGARTNLGAQALDTELTALAALTSAADKLPYFTGSGTANVVSFNGIARQFISQTSFAGMISLIGGVANTYLQTTLGTYTTKAYAASNTYVNSRFSQVLTRGQIDNLYTGTMQFVMDGSGSAITTGRKLDLGPFDMDITIQAVTLLADVSGSIVLDFWVKDYTTAGYPPTVTQTITALDKPTISSATNSQNKTLTGWTKFIPQGKTLTVNVDSCTTITRCGVAIKFRRS